MRGEWRIEVAVFSGKEGEGRRLGSRSIRCIFSARGSRQ